MPLVQIQVSAFSVGSLYCAACVRLAPIVVPAGAALALKMGGNGKHVIRILESDMEWAMENIAWSSL